MTLSIAFPDQDTAAALQEQVVTRLYDLAKRGVITEWRRDEYDRQFAEQFDRDTTVQVRVAVAERWLHRIERLERSEA